MQPYTHILQKTGILRTFTVAKLVKKKEIDDLKTLIENVAADEAEYNSMLAEELSKISDMHDTKNPIPGIIYGNDFDKKNIIIKITKKFSKIVKDQKLDTKEMAFLVSAIINDLGLTQEDFQNLKNELEAEDEDEDYDDENDDEYED